MSDHFRRDFETVEEYRARLRVEDQAEQPVGGEPESTSEPPSPFIVDCGIYTSRRDREAIQREEDRITRLERMGR